MAKSKAAKKKRKAKTLAKAAPAGRLDLIAGAWATELGRRGPVMRLLAEAAELADQPPLLALCLGTIGLGVARGDQRLKRTGVRMLAAFLLATAAKSIGKQIVSRTRPSRLVDLGTHETRLDGPSGEEYESFPSGHTAGAVAIARAIGREFPDIEQHALTAAVSAGVLKILKGDHFPSDILVGLVLGVVAELVADRALEKGNRAFSGGVP